MPSQYPPETPDDYVMDIETIAGELTRPEEGTAKRIRSLIREAPRFTPRCAQDALRVATVMLDESAWEARRHWKRTRRNAMGAAAFGVVLAGLLGASVAVPPESQGLWRWGLIAFAALVAVYALVETRRVQYCTDQLDDLVGPADQLVEALRKEFPALPPPSGYRGSAFDPGATVSPEPARPPHDDGNP